MTFIMRVVVGFTLMSWAFPVLSQEPASSPAASTSVTDHPTANVTTLIKINSSDAGRTFYGVGAISGGGGNSRLLIDYPAKQRDQILDYLFKRGYGASLQMLKLEIGGDANSTDGSEPSVEHSLGVVNCNAGYEFWRAEQAKRRNPEIKLYGLAWAAPGWIGSGKFWSQDMVDYLMTWMDCAHSHGLTIDYIGGWNERGFDATWYKSLKTALAAKQFTTKVVGDDSGWKVADALAKDPAFASAVDIIGVHYSCEGGDGGNANTCQSTKTAVSMAKPLWDSESGSQDDNTGAGPLIRAITRGYIDAKMTNFLNWPLIAAITPNLPFSTVGLMVSAQPWSGAYSIGRSLWVTAQVTQFTQPGWQFLDGASGYLGGERTNGSYISLRSPDGTAYSTIVETTTASAASTLTFSVSGKLSGKEVHVWATNLKSIADKDQFAHRADLHPDGTGLYHFALRPGYVYTFSTVETSGRGTPIAPPPRALALPYEDNFDRYRAGEEARYASDMQGSFEVQPCASGRPGKCLQQMAATKPIEWQDDSDVFTLLGDSSWTNYTVSVDAELAKPGVIELIGRAGTQKRPQSHQQGYFFQISDTGAWTIIKSDDDGKHSTLGSGSINALGIGRWHRLALSLKNERITASVDGQQICALNDNSYQAGDWCGARMIYKDDDLQAVYQKMGDALLKSGRPIVYSLSEYGNGHVDTWGANVGANLWRTTGDIRDSWSSMIGNIMKQIPTATSAGPGHWNDPDMLEIGNGHMTDDEYRTHMSLWALTAAPLLAGNDIRTTTSATKEILLNREVIAVDQDTLGKQASPVKTGDLQMWVKPLADGSVAVGVVNMGTTETAVTVKVSDLGLSAGVKTARDLWKHADVAFHDGVYASNVLSHGVLMQQVSGGK